MSCEGSRPGLTRPSHIHPLPLIREPGGPEAGAEGLAPHSPLRGVQCKRSLGTQATNVDSEQTMQAQTQKLQTTSSSPCRC
jgi:hypothetical protein